MIAECAGTPSALRLAFSIIGWRGRIALEGSFQEHAQFPIEPYFFQLRAMTLQGICGWGTPDFARALDLVSSGQIDVKPLVTHILPLAQWEKAFHLVTNRKDESIKVQLAP